MIETILVLKISIPAGRIDFKYGMWLYKDGGGGGIISKSRSSNAIIEMIVSDMYLWRKNLGFLFKVEANIICFNAHYCSFQLMFLNKSYLYKTMSCTLDILLRKKMCPKFTTVHRQYSQQKVSCWVVLLLASISVMLSFMLM